MIGKLYDSICYYAYIDNLHKHPIISKVMCKLGRHDYEVDVSTGPREAVLFCMRCGVRKHSKNTSK